MPPAVIFSLFIHLAILPSLHFLALPPSIRVPFTCVSLSLCLSPYFPFHQSILPATSHPSFLSGPQPVHPFIQLLPSIFSLLASSHLSFPTHSHLSFIHLSIQTPLHPSVHPSLPLSPPVPPAAVLSSAYPPILPLSVPCSSQPFVHLEVTIRRSNRVWLTLPQCPSPSPPLLPLDLVLDL